MQAFLDPISTYLKENLIAFVAFIISLISLARTYRKDKVDENQKIAEKRSEIKIQLKGLLDLIDVQINKIPELEKKLESNGQRFQAQLEKHKSNHEIDIVELTKSLEIVSLNLKESIQILQDRRNIIYNAFLSTIGGKKFKSQLEVIELSGRIIDFEFFVREADKDVPKVQASLEVISGMLDKMEAWLFMD